MVKQLILFLAVLIIFSSAIESDFYFETHNYTIYTSSPNKKFKLIGVPVSDCNETEGGIFVTENNKVLYSFSVERYQEHLFVVSDDGKTVIVFPGHIGSFGVRDPRFMYIYVYKLGIPSDTIPFGEFWFKQVKKTRNRKKDRKKLMVPRYKNSYPSIQTKQDTLMLYASYAKRRTFIKLSEGRIVERTSTSIVGFKELKFKLKRLDSFEREKLVNKLEKES